MFWVSFYESNDRNIVYLKQAGLHNESSLKKNAKPKY